MSLEGGFLQQILGRDPRQPILGKGAAREGSAEYKRSDLPHKSRDKTVERAGDDSSDTRSKEGESIEQKESRKFSEHLRDKRQDRGVDDQGSPKKRDVEQDKVASRSAKTDKSSGDVTDEYSTPQKGPEPSEHDGAKVAQGKDSQGKDSQGKDTLPVKSRQPQTEVPNSEDVVIAVEASDVPEVVRAQLQSPEKSQGLSEVSAATRQQAFGVILPKSDASADASPLILIKEQVEKLAAHLLSLGVVSPDPASMSDKDFAFQKAVELYGLVDALAKIAQQFEARETFARDQIGMIILPPESRQALELLTDLQSILDADSFAALLGDLPKITFFEGAQAEQMVKKLAAQQDKSGMTLQEDAILVALQFVSDASAETPAEQLPEWLSDAVVPQAFVGYARHGEKNAGARSDQSVASGQALRHHLDQKASQYMQSQRHTLPKKLQALLNIPIEGSSDYQAWVDQVSQVVHHASFRSDFAATPAMGAASTYVFEDPDVTRFLQMMPVSALRDVVRGAGKLSRRVAAQDSLVRSQGAMLQTQSASKEMHVQLGETFSRPEPSLSAESPARSRLDGESLQWQEAGTRPSLRPEVPWKEGEVTSESPRRSGGMSLSLEAMKSRGAGSAPVMAPPTTPPTTHSQMAERDTRARSQSRAPQGREAASESRQMTSERRESRLVDQVQYHRVETEQPRSLGNVEQAEMPMSKTQGGSLSQAEQAARNQRQQQIMRIAQLMRSQITLHVLRQVQSNTKNLELQLNPRRLGKIEVQISREVGSKIAIRFTVENADTLEALRSSIDGLLQSLREAGISADSGSMSFTLKEENSQNFEQKRKKAMTEAVQEEEEEILGLGQTAEVSEEGHVNVRV